MIKYIKVTLITFFLLLPMMAFADDDRLDKIDAYPQKKGEKLIEYKNDIPQYGNYYEWDGKKWQRYEGNIPQSGDYLKNITRGKNPGETKSK